jgi:hypothetical protein
MQPADYQLHAKHQHVAVFEWVHLINKVEPPIHWAAFRRDYVDEPNPAAPLFNELRETYKALKAGMDSGQLKYVRGPGWYGLHRIEPRELLRWSKAHRFVTLPRALAGAIPQVAKETPIQRRQRLVNRRDELIASGERAWQKKLAAEEGVSASAIKGILAKAAAKKSAEPQRLSTLALAARQTVSKKR